MSAAYPWLEPPWPEKKLSRDELEQRLLQLVASQNVCVLATNRKDGHPIASPIEYHADGLTLYMLADPGTPKLLSMKRDPRVAAAIQTGFRGWPSIRSAQFFAHAEILQPHTPEWDHGMTIFKWRAAQEEVGMDTSKPIEWEMTKLVPDRIFYMETWLWQSGYNWKQWWLADSEESAAPEALKPNEIQ